MKGIILACLLHLRVDPSDGVGNIMTTNFWYNFLLNAVGLYSFIFTICLDRSSTNTNMIDIFFLFDRENVGKQVKQVFVEILDQR